VLLRHCSGNSEVPLRVTQGIAPRESRLKANLRLIWLNACHTACMVASFVHSLIRLSGSATEQGWWFNLTNHVSCLAKCSTAQVCMCAM
jgi:hypothetical protein